MQIASLSAIITLSRYESSNENAQILLLEEHMSVRQCNLFQH